MKQMILMALVLAAPAMAQQSQDPGTPRTPLQNDRGYDKDQARTDAINAQVKPELAPATAAANAQTLAKDASGPAVSADAQAAYNYDMQVYLDRLRARDAAAVGNEMQYHAKQRAYADAMRAWRVQVYDCNRGIIAACRAPTPDPAAFY
jgi:hypothetical protein